MTCQRHGRTREETERPRGEVHGKAWEWGAAPPWAAVAHLTAPPGQPHRQRGKGAIPRRTCGSNRTLVSDLWLGPCLLSFRPEASLFLWVGGAVLTPHEVTQALRQVTRTEASPIP